MNDEKLSIKITVDDITEDHYSHKIKSSRSKCLWDCHQWSSNRAEHLVQPKSVAHVYVYGQTCGSICGTSEHNAWRSTSLCGNGSKQLTIYTPKVSVESTCCRSNQLITGDSEG